MKLLTNEAGGKICCQNVTAHGDWRGNAYRQRRQFLVHVKAGSLAIKARSHPLIPLQKQDKSSHPAQDNPTHRPY